MNDKFQYNKELTTFSRSNRKQQTDAEKLLWQKLRNRQLQGFKFHRQYPTQNYILDFYCIEKKLAVELDGSQHMEQTEYDEIRSLALKKYGITVLRFWDNDMFTNTDGILTTILDHLTSS